jgi:hypothetical protein
MTRQRPRIGLPGGAVGALGWYDGGGGGRRTSGR